MPNFFARVVKYQIRILSVLLILSLIFNITLGFLLFRERRTTENADIQSVRGASEIQLLSTPINLTGVKEIKSFTVPLLPDALEDKDTLLIYINLHGLCLLPAGASLAAFKDDLGKLYSVSIKDHVKNCYNGEQTASIPLSLFFQTKIYPKAISFEMQFWYPAQFGIDILSVSVHNSVLGKANDRRPTQKPKQSNNPNITETPDPIPSEYPVVTNTPQPTPAPTMVLTPTDQPTGGVSPTPTAVQNSWIIRSVSSMKETKDRICNQRNADFIQNWVNTAAELGVTHIAVETPYDDPACGSAVSYTKAWVDAIHNRGIKVWHRHMPLAFEGIYNTAKNNSIDYFVQITNYIIANPTLFADGDIFTPIPEPQNGGIAGITYCPQGICMFSGKTYFNTWLRDAITVSENAFARIGLSQKVGIGYFGFDGFVAWGDNNPDWEGILEEDTVAKMGNITIDHYPEIVGDTMEKDLNELQAKYPATPIVIGEWGTITGGDTEAQVLTSMQAAKQSNVIGFNYWHMGVGGNEALINEDLSKNTQFDEVQQFYR